MNRKYPTNAKPPTFRNAPGDKMVKRLMLLIIFQAMRDAAGRDDAGPEDIADAKRFLQSEEYYAFCNHLGVKPSKAKGLVESLVEE